jgi:hypothetical protein
MLSVEPPSYVVLDLRLSVTSRSHVSHVRYVVLSLPPRLADGLFSRGEDVPLYVQMVCVPNWLLTMLVLTCSPWYYRQSCDRPGNSVRTLSAHIRVVLSVS